MKLNDNARGLQNHSSVAVDVRFRRARIARTVRNGTISSSRTILPISVSHLSPLFAVLTKSNETERFSKTQKWDHCGRGTYADAFSSRSIFRPGSSAGG